MADAEAFAAVARRVVSGGQLLRCWSLEGGVSAGMHALEVGGSDGEVRRVVVRRHGAADFKSLPAEVTKTEFALLEALRGIGIPVPAPLLFDDSCAVMPSPYLVMDFVEGTTEVDAAARPQALREMAAFLARLHGLDVDRSHLPVLPEREDPREGALAYLPSSDLGERLRVALTSGSADASANPRSLLHGDFWPGNILCRDGQLAAVVDWEDAAIGDPLSDLACCRVELLCAYDRAAMDAFTAHYTSLASVDLEKLELWELYVSAAALASMADWGLAPEVEARRRAATEGFMERAGRALLSG